MTSMTMMMLIVTMMTMMLMLMMVTVTMLIVTMTMALTMTMTPGGFLQWLEAASCSLLSAVLPFKGAAACENYTCDDDDGDDDDQDHIVKDNVEESAAGTEVPRRACPRHTPIQCNFNAIQCNAIL